MINTFNLGTSKVLTLKISPKKQAKGNWVIWSGFSSQKGSQSYEKGWSLPKVNNNINKSKSWTRAVKKTGGELSG
jgi:hypothetical protein